GAKGTGSDSQDSGAKGTGSDSQDSGNGSAK
ncbi:lipoprotein VlpB, partial [Mycoplasma hyorhinis]|nr:lipoprotein VlpB [Mesomycoplasma hyorhinis]MXR44066.1 lipoprotein VlpB [Mesomycoplasma hyorhinis]